MRERYYNNQGRLFPGGIAIKGATASSVVGELADGVDGDRADAEGFKRPPKSKTNSHGGALLHHMLLCSGKPPENGSTSRLTQQGHHPIKRKASMS